MARLKLKYYIFVGDIMRLGYWLRVPKSIFRKYGYMKKVSYCDVG